MGTRYLVTSQNLVKDVLIRSKCDPVVEDTDQCCMGVRCEQITPVLHVFANQEQKETKWKDRKSE